MISRLDEQKGLELVAEISEAFLGLNVQFVVLGTGIRKYHEFLLHLKAKYARKLSVNLAFNNELSHRIYAGADMFLMPSKYEPCGLGQLIAMRYGTVPVGRQTGGLTDTVTDFNGQTGNGFCFKRFSGQDLLATLKRACDAYADSEVWNRVARNAMASDFSWERAAGEYHLLYHRMARL